MKVNLIDYLLSVDTNYLTETEPTTVLKEYVQKVDPGRVPLRNTLLRWKAVVECCMCSSSVQRDAIAHFVREMVLNMYRDDRYRIFLRAIIPVLVDGKAYYLEYVPPMRNRITPPIPQIFLRDTVDKNPFPDDDMNPRPDENNENAMAQGILAYIIHYGIMEKRYRILQTLDFLCTDDIDYALNTEQVHRCLDKTNPINLADVVCLKWEKPWIEILNDYIDILHPISKEWIQQSPHVNPAFAEDDKIINEIFISSRDHPLNHLHDTILWLGFTKLQQFYIDNYYQQFYNHLMPRTDKKLIREEVIKDFLKRGVIWNVQLKSSLFNYIKPDIAPRIQKEIDDTFRMCADYNDAPLLVNMINKYAPMGYFTFKNIHDMNLRRFIKDFNKHYDCEIKYDWFYKKASETK